MKARNHLAMGWSTIRLDDERNEDIVVRFKSGAKKLVYAMKTFGLWKSARHGSSQVTKKFN